MDSLVGYGSDDDNETAMRYHGRRNSGSGAAGGSRRRDDDTNYDDVNMDMSEDSQAESEPELPPAEPPAPPPRHSRDDRRGSDDSRDARRERRRESPPRAKERERDKRSPRRDERHHRSDRAERRRGSRESSSSRRGLLGDRPSDRPGDRPSDRPGDRPSDPKVPALMDLKPFGGDAPPPGYGKSHDARDAVSPRFVERGERRDRERERDRERHGRRSEEKRSSGRAERRRSRSRGAPHAHPAHSAPAPHGSSSNDRRGSPPSGDYRSTSYKVNKKLEVMEKMGLQIKTPDGSMATAQQLRAAASEAPAAGAGGLPSYYNSSAVSASKILDQVQKRKLLWSGKSKSEAEEAAKWSGTRFAQDSDGRQVNKFMRLMGIKEPAAVKPEPADTAADPIKKQEELFQAMQAQYEVARATTHTMRGVGLGFQRGQY